MDHDSYRILVGHETKASGSVGFPVKHDNRIRDLSKLRKEVVELGFGNCVRRRECKSR